MWFCVCLCEGIYCVYISKVLCVCSGAANENVAHTDVAFGTSNVLEQDV